MEAITFESKISPVQIEGGNRINTHCEYTGQLDSGFFDLAIIIGDTKIWLSDENTWNSYRDTGIMQRSGHFSSDWKPFIPDWIPKGDYTVSAMVFEDKGGKNKGRTLLKEKIFKVTILDSNHIEAVFVRKLYALFFDRIPDIGGYKTWFENLQLRGVDKRQVLEIGFLRSIEFRAIFVHKLLTDEKINKDDLSSSINILYTSSLSKLVSEKYPHITREELHKDLVNFLGLEKNGQGMTELLRIEQFSSPVGEVLEIVIQNFLLEKYVLMRQLFPELSVEQR